MIAVFFIFVRLRI